MIKNVVALLIMLYSSVACADDLQLFNSFVLCKSDFFNTLYKNKEELQKHTDIQTFSNNQAYIPVSNRSDSSKNYVYFTTPIIYKGLTITGYYDSAMDLGKMGKYYFWGFIIDNNLEQIKNSFDSLSWKEMENNLLYIANPQIRYVNDEITTWNDNTGTVVGVKTIPAPDTTEKLLLLEKGPNMTMLICSIQGVVPPELLRIERPDIQQP